MRPDELTRNERCDPGLAEFAIWGYLHDDLGYAEPGGCDCYD
jgi:hypothetical protein